MLDAHIPQELQAGDEPEPWSARLYVIHWRAARLPAFPHRSIRKPFDLNFSVWPFWKRGGGGTQTIRILCPLKTR